MTSSYFSNFNVINYGAANTPAIDITERDVIQRQSMFNPFIYYPLDISDGVRPDVLSYQTFGDPFASWVLYLTNNIIDPYYDWYVPQADFIAYINGKYGSITNAQQQVMYFQTDWTNAEPISINTYNALDADQQKYYEPNYGNGPYLLNYTQKQQQLTVTTNFVVDLTVTGNTSTFQFNEVVNLVMSPTQNGTAQVMSSNATDLIVQHIQFLNNPNNNIAVTNTSYVYGTNSGTNCAITNVTWMANNINADELSFWSPVYAYDLELIRNQGNRIINVLDSKYLPTVLNQTANLLGQIIK